MIKIQIAQFQSEAAFAEIPQALSEMLSAHNNIDAIKPHLILEQALLTLYANISMLFHFFE